MTMGPFFIWILLLMLFLAAGYMLGLRRAAATARLQPSTGPMDPDHLATLENMVMPVLDITARKGLGELAEFEGHLRTTAEEAMWQLKSVLKPLGLTPLLQEGQEDDVQLLLLPTREQPVRAASTRWGIHLLLFVATLLTTTWAGALQSGVNLLHEPGRFAVGLPYSLALMLILGAHELGHYFTARYHKIAVTPPFFIPVPFALGTFGAFIRIKSLSPNRRAVFDVAVAGPLAGLVFAIPALIIGLKLSHVVPVHPLGGAAHLTLPFGSSVLVVALAKLALGPAVTHGHGLLLHPLAFAGWLGLLITALNLLPIGQLDGGHMAHALFGGRRGHKISVVGLVALFALALFVWPGLMMWALIVWMIAGTRDMPPLNDVTPVGWGRMTLGLCTFLLLAMMLIPMPLG